MTQTNYAFSTPFGEKSVTLAMLATQRQTQDHRADEYRQTEVQLDKWKLFRLICEAKTRLAVSDRSLAVLNALLSFYPQVELAGQGSLIVFPSNAQLSLRCHGMAAATLRRHLAQLVAAGLIIRKDSPNGKRYARKGAGGTLADAFGFDLAPLVVRAGEFNHLAEETRQAQTRIKVLRETISLLKRDIEKLALLGLEVLPAIDWAGLIQQMKGSLRGFTRNMMDEDMLESLTHQLRQLHARASQDLDALVHNDKNNGNAAHYEHHYHNSKTNSFNESELALEKEQGATSQSPDHKDELAEREEENLGTRANQERSITLGLALKACPELANYALEEIKDWDGFIRVVEVVRSMLGISPSVYAAASEKWGRQQAAVIVACLLQRAQTIRSAGGYLRSLLRKAEKGEFSPWPMLIAQLRENGEFPKVIS